jgi:tetratricopeptide (TPR) repeat protein
MVQLIATLGDHDTRDEMDRAIDRHPTCTLLLASRGDVYHSLGHDRRLQAMADLDRALAPDPESGPALALRGAAYYGLSRLHEALADLDRAIALDPDYVWALADRAAIYLDLRRYEDAMHEIERAVALDPGDRSVLHTRGRIAATMGVEGKATRASKKRARRRGATHGPAGSGMSRTTRYVRLGSHAIYRWTGHGTPATRRSASRLSLPSWLTAAPPA